MQTQRSPNQLRAAQTTDKESVLSRLFITPLTFLSFILSLALISNNNTSSRTHRTSPQSHPTTLLGRTTQFMKSIFFTTNEQSRNPYAYVVNPSSLGEGDGRPKLERGASSSSRVKDGQEGWYWHNNQKKLLKMEVTEALEMRKWVLVVLLGAMGVGLGVGALALRRLWAMSVNSGWLG